MTEDEVKALIERMTILEEIALPVRLTAAKFSALFTLGRRGLAADKLAEALEKAKAALLSGDPDGITRDDVTIYRLDGGKVGVALDAVRQALAAYQSDTGGDAT
jgi:hypothetical protein